MKNTSIREKNKKSGKSTRRTFKTVNRVKRMKKKTHLFKLSTTAECTIYTPDFTFSLRISVRSLLSRSSSVNSYVISSVGAEILKDNIA